MSPRMLVADGSGLIRRAFAARLVADGAAVTVLSRSERPMRDVDVVRWDGGTPGAWGASLAGADGVVNLCGASVGSRPWTARRRRELRTSRLDPTAALVEAISALPPAQRPRVPVNASGTDLYEGRDER